MYAGWVSEHGGVGGNFEEGVHLLGVVDIGRLREPAGGCWSGEALASASVAPVGTCRAAAPPRWRRKRLAKAIGNPSTSRCGTQQHAGSAQPRRRVPEHRRRAAMSEQVFGLATGKLTRRCPHVRRGCPSIACGNTPHGEYTSADTTAADLLKKHTPHVPTYNCCVILS